MLRRLHIRSLLAVFLLNFVLFPHGRRPYWRESLAFFPHNIVTCQLSSSALFCVLLALRFLMGGARTHVLRRLYQSQEVVVGRRPYQTQEVSKHKQHTLAKLTSDKQTGLASENYHGVVFVVVVAVVIVVIIVVTMMLLLLLLPL